ncbi:MAG: hypothetical protein K8T25_18175 [Planctomycetia bacterium]|nr:hypothetical protein [Planctomycetia bacterium]
MFNTKRRVAQTVIIGSPIWGFVSLVLFIAPASARTWTNASGSSHTEADFVETKDGLVKLKKLDGTVIAVPLGKLSRQDQEFVKSQGDGSPPLEKVARPDNQPPRDKEAEKGPSEARENSGDQTKKGATGPPVERRAVYLADPTAWGFWDGQTIRQTLLGREIVRQAVLLAARDLNLVTRDAVLAQHAPKGKGTISLEVITVPGSPSSIEILVGERYKRELLKSFPVETPRPFDYVRLTEKMELASQNEFRTFFLSQGCKPRDRRPESNAPVPPDIAKLLTQMHFMSQFFAVRRLHELLESEGDSPHLLFALVQGYTNLGKLTEYYWQPAHDVFKARALLYAQRLVRQRKEDAFSLLARAYALGVTGLHAAALEDLQRAAVKAPKEVPDWVQPVTNLCQSSSMPQDMHDAPRTEFAYLMLWEELGNTGTFKLVIDWGLKALKVMPANYYVQSAVTNCAGVRLGHVMTVAGLSSATADFYERMKDVPHVPASVARLVQDYRPEQRVAATTDFKQRRELIEGLSQSNDDLNGDVAEMSWPTLGLLMRELGFIQALQRAKFLRDALGVPADDFLEQSKPLYEGHRFQDYILWHSNDPLKQNKAAKSLSGVGARDMLVAGQLLASAIRTVDPYRADIVTRQFTTNRDLVPNTLIGLTVVYDQPQQRAMRRVLVDELVQSSPRNPWARKQLIDDDWNEARLHADQWEREDLAHPHVLMAMSRQYCIADRLPDAERCLQRIPQSMRDQDMYTLLAFIYDKQGDEDKWLGAMKAMLSLPDYGLQHSNVNDTIAQRYMARRQWKKALPYAMASASSYWSRGLTTLANCYEALQEWDKADELQQANAERYENSRANWWMFCVRTGKGNKKQATELMEAYMRDNQSSPQNEFPVYYQITGKLNLFLANFKDANVLPFNAIWHALVAQQAGDVATRRRVLTQTALIQGGAEQNMKLLPLANALQDGWENNRPARLADFDALRPPADADDFRQTQTWHDYFVGKYLMLRGNRDDAVKSWLRCMESPLIEDTLRTLAGAELLQLGIGPEKYAKELQSPIADRTARKP